jgi:redox-sensing transcriptional repressor
VRASSPEGQSGQPRGAGVPPSQRDPRGDQRAERDGVRGIPDASIARLPRYLRALHDLAASGASTVSSEELAAASSVNSAKLRRDLSYLGSYGTRGVGYPVELLVYQIERELGLTHDWPVVIVGVGNLGRALANYGGFATRGLRIACLVDADQRRVGEIVGGLPVRHVEELERLVMKHRVAIGVVATPPAAAQEVCDRLIAAGVRSILNFASAVVVVPDGVELRGVDLSTELQILAFHEQRRQHASSGGRVVPEQAAGTQTVMPA